MLTLSAMRRRHKTAIIVLLLIGGILCTVMAMWPREATLQGRKLSQWMADLSSDSHERVEQARSAVRQMGTNAIPGLLASMRAKESRFKAALIHMVGAQTVAELGLVPAQEHRRRALKGFLLLGPVAKPAIPTLVTILNNGETASSAALVLVHLGPEGMAALTNNYSNSDSRVRPAIIEAVRRKNANAQHNLEMMADFFVPVLLQYLEDRDIDVRAPAAEALGDMAAQPERVVPALLKLLQDSELYPRSAAVQALGCYGTRAKVAVPALVEYARRAGNKSERDEAIKALNQIDPEAVATAGLKRG